MILALLGVVFVETNIGGFDGKGSDGKGFEGKGWDGKGWDKGGFDKGRAACFLRAHMPTFSDDNWEVDSVSNLEF